MSKPVKAYVASFVPKKKEDAVRGNLVKKAAAPAATAGAKKAVAPAALAAPAVAKKSIDPHVNKASAGKKAGSIKTDEQKVDSVSSAEDALKKMQLKTQGKLQEQDAAEAAKRKKELDAANAAKKKKEQAENKDFSYGPSGGMLVPLPGKDDIMSKDGEMQSIQYSGSRGGRPLANKPKTQRLIFTPSDVDQSILIHLTELNNVLDWCKQQGKVPLLMDTSGQVDIFFTYNNATIIDAKKLFVSLKVVKNMTMEDCLEELRKKTVAAMKYGHKLILALTNTATDFLNQFNDDTHFPTPVIFNKQTILDEDEYTKIIRKQDLDNNGFFTMLSKKDYQFCVTSHFEMEDCVDFLSDAIPLHECQKIEIKIGPFEEFAATYLK